MNPENSTRAYEFATYNKPLPRFMKKRVYERVDYAHKPKKGLCRGHKRIVKVYYSTPIFYSVLMIFLGLLLVFDYPTIIHLYAGHL